MNDSYFWLATCLTCLLALVVLAAATCLFLVRRLDGLTRAHEATQQRLVQIAYDLRRLEQWAVDPSRPRFPEVEADHGAAEGILPLISVPDMGFEGRADDGSGLAEKHREVWSLIEEGKTPQEISLATSRPIGQVELIIGLYRQHQASRPQGRHDTSS
ncbi:hypothetical protein [Paludisphaera mucosa]|uniref:DUF2802 domain-containing protein n=1 Tax=Paludisphaera mucosa TaxID=3030827 RepID=A0ABT6F6C7_9BACT|nr:hypothetical protein [Paludisphaera mucosa]MDG3003153.1 hypothetical protein [Paludisphaera mucosa]